MIRRSTVLILASALLGGCAAAVPGYVPLTPQREKMLAAAPQGGGFAETGSYGLTDQEQALDCKHLTGGMTIKIIQMRDATNRAKPSAAASAMQEGLRPLKGGTTYAQDLTVDLKRDRARLETLNARLVEKGCKSFDIEAQLKAGNSETPKPTIEPPKGDSKKRS